MIPYKFMLCNIYPGALLLLKTNAKQFALFEKKKQNNRKLCCSG